MKSTTFTFYALLVGRSSPQFQGALGMKVCFFFIPLFFFLILILIFLMLQLSVYIPMVIMVRSLKNSFVSLSEEGCACLL